MLGQLLETFLTAENKVSVPVTVILDAPWGYAHDAFVNLEGSKTLIATDNPCGEYWDDLWDLGPTVLVARQLPPGELLSLIDQAATGKKLRLTPFYSSPLTRTERKILRLCATQQNLKRVAELAQVGSGTLKNYLSAIYSKLELEGLVDLNLYYFGGKKPK